MRFKRKYKIKKATYFQTYRDIIGLYRKEYLDLKDQLPFHSIEYSGPFVLIQLSCPLSSYYSLKKYYHFGNRLDFEFLKLQNAFPPETNLNNREVHNSNVVLEGDTPLPADFNPCSLCKKEFECMFSVNKKAYTPKNFDLLYFLDIIKENGFKESDKMYNDYASYASYHSDDYDWDESEPAHWSDLVIVFAFILPIALLYLPFHFTLLFFQWIKDISKPVKSNE